MQVFVDADGCPVVDQTIDAARRVHAQVVLVCDTAHHFDRDGARTITVDQGADSADFYLVNLLTPGDVVVTQDYGLAAMALSRRARAVSQDGLVYTLDNIDALLLSRHTARKIRRAGGRLRGPAKRTREQDAQFEKAIRLLLEGTGEDA